MNIFNMLTNKKGSSLVGALVVMTVLAAAAAGVIQLSGTDTKSTIDTKQTSQAEAISTAGLEYARDKLNHGFSPDGTNTFGEGQFTIKTDPANSFITSTGKVGDAKKSQSINADFTRNCVELVTDFAYIHGKKLHNVQLVKKCNAQSILGKLNLAWNWGACAMGIGCGGGSVGDQLKDLPTDALLPNNVYEKTLPPLAGKFWICHVPPGNPQAKHTIAVDIDGWINGHGKGKGHHGFDYLGPCVTAGAQAQVDITAECDKEGLEFEKVSAAPTGKIWVCHVPPNDSQAAQTISVSAEGWENGHKGVHADDYEGPCLKNKNNPGNPNSEKEADLGALSCDGSAKSKEKLAVCTQNDGGARLQEVHFNAQQILFKAGSVPSNTAEATKSGEVTDVKDAYLQTNGVYAVDIYFDKVIPTGAWFNITTEFADGSSLTEPFKAGVQLAPIVPVVQ